MDLDLHFQNRLQVLRSSLSFAFSLWSGASKLVTPFVEWGVVVLFADDAIVCTACPAVFCHWLATTTHDPTVSLTTKRGTETCLLDRKPCQTRRGWSRARRMKKCVSKVINHRTKEQIIVMSVVEIFFLSFLFITLGVETNFSRVSNGRRKEAVKIVECFLRVCGVAVKETTWHFLDFLSCPPGTKNESSLCQCLSLVLLQKPTWKSKGKKAWVKVTISFNT